MSNTIVIEPENVFSELTRLAMEAGTNMNKICIETGISRAVIERWKSNPPKSITNYLKLKKAIQETAQNQK